MRSCLVVGRGGEGRGVECVEACEWSVYEYCGISTRNPFGAGWRFGHVCVCVEGGIGEA